LRRGDIAAHGARQLLDRRQPEPGAAEARCNRNIGLRKWPEQALDLGEREADPAVGDLECDGDLAFRAAQGRDLKGDTPLFGEFYGIVDQVLHRRAQADRIADGECRQLFGNNDRRLQALGRRATGQRIAGVADERAQVEEVLPHLEPRAAAARRIDEQRRKARQMFCAGLDGVDPAPFALVEIGGREQIADRQNARQRRADLVRKGCQRSFDHAGGGDGGFAGTAHVCSGAGYALFR